MLPKRLQSEMIKQWVYGLYTSGICYPRGYKVKWWHSEVMVCIPQVYATQEVTKWNDDSEFMVCIPQVYATQEVTKWNGDTVNLWFVYLRYMLPRRLQSEMIKQWVNGLYTSGICYPRGYKVKWLNSELMVCIPQVYATQEVTKWNDDSEFMVCIPQVYATQEVTKWNGDTVNLWFVYLRYMLPRRLQSEMIKQWVNGLYTSGICYPRGYKVKWLNSELMVCIPQVYATQEVTKWND